MALSWSAQVFDDERAAGEADAHLDDLDLATVVSVFLADLEMRGLEIDPPVDPLHGEEWVAAVAGSYRIPVSH